MAPNPSDLEDPSSRPGDDDTAPASGTEGTHGVQHVSGIALRPPQSDEPALALPVRAAIKQLTRAIDQITEGALDVERAERELREHSRDLRALLVHKEASEGDLKKELARVEAARVADRRKHQASMLQIIEQNDEFLAKLIEDHETQLSRALRERDEVLGQLGRLKLPSPSVANLPKALPSEPPTSRPQSIQARTKTDPGLGGSRAMPSSYDDNSPTVRPPAMPTRDRTAALERQVKQGGDLVEKLLADKQRALELIRRLQTQRDEAHRELANLRRQLNSPPIAPGLRQRSSPDNDRPTDPVPGSPLGSSRPATSTGPGTPPMLRWPADRASGSAWDQPGALPAPPPSLEPALARGPRAPEPAFDTPPELSAALLDATSDAKPRLSPMHNEPRTPERSFGTYSVQPGLEDLKLEGNEVNLKPPRTPS